MQNYADFVIHTMSTKQPPMVVLTGIVQLPISVV